MTTDLSFVFYLPCIVRLIKAGLSNKKKSTTYTEADPQKQKKLQDHLREIESSKIYYLDKSGFDERYFCSSSWSAKGKRLSGKKSAKRP